MTQEERPGGASGENQETDSQSQEDNDDSSRESNRQTSSEELRRTRNEARNLRSRLRETERERDELRSRTETDDERTRNDSQRMQRENATLVERVRNLSVQVAASRMGIIDPDAAARLMDWDDLDLDDANELEKRLKKLTREREWLLGTPKRGVDGGTTGAGSGSLSMNDQIRQAAGYAPIPGQ